MSRVRERMSSEPPVAADAVVILLTLRNFQLSSRFTAEWFVKVMYPRGLLLKGQWKAAIYLTIRDTVHKEKFTLCVNCFLAQSGSFED